MSQSSRNASNKLLKLLSDHSASDVIAFSSDDNKKRGINGVVDIDSKLSPYDAAKIIWENNILGAPVWDEQKRKYCGFFDARDVLSIMVASLKKEDFSSAGLAHQSSQKLGLSICYLAARNTMKSCTMDSDLKEVCEILAKNKMHRVPVYSSGGNDIESKYTNIISQSAVMKFLRHKADPEEFKEKLSDSKLNYRKLVVCIRDTATAFDAFELMDSHRLSGIAVVDEDGKLVHNISARDSKFALRDGGRTSMRMDILSYLARVRQSEKCKNERYPACHVYEHDTVSHVINTMAKTGYHRIFVVDEHLMPIGVISVTDFIMYAIEP